MVSEVRTHVATDPVRIGFLEGTNLQVRMVSGDHPLPVSNPQSRGVFGEQFNTTLDPRIQLDAKYGLRDETDVEVLTENGGTATDPDNLWTVQTGTSVGGYGVIRSRRVVRYRPGFGARFRFTAAFDSANAVANSLQWAGVFTAVDFVGFGYNGTSFGVARRIPGVIELVRLDMSAGTGGATENVTVTLNNVDFDFTIGSGLTAAQAAQVIGEQTYTGWFAEAIGTQVLFYEATPSTNSGSFTFTSDGTAAGTFTELRAGSPNDNDSGHVAQADWNATSMPFTGFDPSKLNAYEITIGYLGSASFSLRVYNPEREVFVEVHRYDFGDQTTPNLEDPTMRVGYIAASLGSTTNLTVTGASMLGAVEGVSVFARNPRAQVASQTAVTTEVNILSIRNGLTFKERINRQELLPNRVAVAVEGNKPAQIRAYINADVTGGSWEYLEEGVSMVHFDTTKAATTNGRLLVASAVAKAGDVTLNLQDLFVRLQPGDTLTITAQSASTTDVTASITWIED